MVDHAIEWAHLFSFLFLLNIVTFYVSANYAQSSAQLHRIQVVEGTTHWYISFQLSSDTYNWYKNRKIERLWMIHWPKIPAEFETYSVKLEINNVAIEPKLRFGFATFWKTLFIVNKKTKSSSMVERFHHMCMYIAIITFSCTTDLYQLYLLPEKLLWGPDKASSIIWVCVYLSGRPIYILLILPYCFVIFYCRYYYSYTRFY